LSSETFVSAMLLITGVVAAAILIVAVLPVIWGMIGTFSTASAATDRQIRTDFKIVTTYAKYSPAPGNTGVNFTIWMKNTGTATYASSDLSNADVYLGLSSSFARATLSSPYYSVPVKTSSTKWSFNVTNGDTNANGFWDTGETLQVDAFYYWPAGTSLTGQTMYFQFTLPNSVTRSSQFTSL
jgi:hypothetical protein